MQNASEEIFNMMPPRDATTSSAMILGLAKNGKNGMGVELFMSIEKRGPRSNAVTFVGVLTAYGKIKIFGVTLMGR